MAIDWSILSARGGDDIADYVQRNRQLANQRAVAETQARELAFKTEQAKRAQASNAAAAAKYRTGDFQGAQADLIESGDSQMVNAGSASSKETFAQRTQGVNTISFMANELTKMPYDQRKASILQAAPLLIASGAKREDVMAIANDPNDDALNAVAKMFYSTEKQDANDRQVETNITNQQNAVTNTMNAETDRMREIRAQQTPVAIDPSSNVYLPGGASGSVGNVGQGGFEAIDNGWMKPIEGGYAAQDGASGAPVNFGINQRANPDIDVKSLTPERAAAIRKARYWDKSGAGQLQNPAAQAIAYDTAMNMGVSASQQMIQATGGDPEKMLQWREQRYRQIARDPKQAGNLGTWLDRNAKLRRYAGAGVGQATGPQMIQQGRPGAVRMSDAEVQAENLDPNQTWYRNKDGLPVSVNKPTGSQTAKANPQQLEQSYSMALRTAQDLLNHPGLNAAVGLPSMNPFDGNLAGYIVPGSKAQDFVNKLETLQSQVFLPMVQALKGMGALSNMEGERMTRAIGAIQRSGSEAAFRQNLQQVISDLKIFADRARAGEVVNPRTQKLERRAPQGAPQPGQVVSRNGRNFRWTGSTWQEVK